jgi:ribosomal protein S18 acetylase RimI-like enzyme
VAPDVSILDNPAWAALNGPHQGLAEVHGRARRYPVDVSPFVGVPLGDDDGAWADLRALVGPGGSLVMIGNGVAVPEDWTVDFSGDGVQLVATDRFGTAPFGDAVVLGDEDAEEMLDLTARTKPGPFLPRTHVMGTYLGVRREGRLVAMAGERLHPPGWTEISAVCTDPDFRGQGLGTRLVQAVGHGIRARGEIPMMHAAATNDSAIRLYRALGFEIRREVSFFAARAPAAEGALEYGT